MSLTQSQLKQRLNYVTGSDAGTICGVNKWDNVVSLWEKKLGVKVAEDISDKPAVKAGNMLEDAVANWFAHETGKEIYVDSEFKVHKEHKWMGGNIDRAIEGESAILECKTARVDKGWGTPWTNQIPTNYLCQVAHYAAVCDVEKVYIAVLFHGVDFRIYLYERDREFENEIISRETQFWECVKAKVPPEPQCSQDIIDIHRGSLSDECEVAGPNVIKALDRLKLQKSAVDALLDDIKSIELEIKAAMKDKQTLVDEDGCVLATWKETKPRSMFDSKAFREKYDELYKEFMREGKSSRPFKVKG